MFKNIGIEQKLLVVFLFFSFFGLCSAVLSWWWLDKTSKNQEVLLEDSLPLLKASKSLVLNASHLVLITPTLQQISTFESFEQFKGFAQKRIQKLNVEIQAFNKNYTNLGASSGLGELITAASQNTEKQIDLVGKRLQLQMELRNDQEEMLKQISLLSLKVKSIIASLISEISTQQSDNSNIYKLEMITKLRFNLLILKDIAQKLPQLETAQSISLTKQQYLVYVRRLAREILSVDKQASQKLGQYIDKLFSYASDKGNIFHNALLLRGYDQNIDTLGLENSNLVQSLKEQIRHISEVSEQNVSRSYEETKQAIGISFYIVIVIALLTVCAPLLIVIGYVHPQIILKLRAITQHTKALAKGDFSIQIDTSGADELADMSKALDQFRRDLIAKQKAEMALIESEESLKQTVEQLTDANMELERFAYIASHDMQEPLRMIVNFTQLLADQYGDQLDEDGHRYIQYASNSALRMRALVEDLLEYGRIDYAQKDYDLVDCNEILSRALEHLNDAISNVNAEFTYDELPSVKAQDSLLLSLFQNLISNGIKYQAPDTQPKISIQVKDLGENWQFSIQDNGIGMKPEYCQQIFEPFKRLHAKSAYPGTGIGLAICKKIIKAFGGEIWAESELGQGSRFLFTIPKAESSSNDTHEQLKRAS